MSSSTTTAMSATTTPAAASAKKATAKAKESLAEDLTLSIAEMMARKIMWVPFVLSPDDSEMLGLVAKAREQKVFIAPAKALTDWLENNREALEAEAQAVRVSDERTEEEIQKETEALTKKLATLNAKLAEKKNGKG
ncbi:MAG: hypothetical protein V4671_00225 [Armatimonadota bacterium]